MTFAIVVPSAILVTRTTMAPRGFAAGLRQLGHQPTIVAHSNGAVPLPDEPGLIQVDTRALQDPAFFQEYDVAVIFTWLHSHAAIVNSAVGAGKLVISKGDTHGEIGVRAHPIPTLRHAFHSAEGAAPKTRSIWHWAKKLAYLDQSYVDAVLANLQRAQATIVETDPAREALVRFLDRHGVATFASKVHVVPIPVADVFCSAPLPAEKDRLVYAVGRWGAPEKNPRLIANVLQRFLEQDRQAHAVLVGNGAEEIVRRVASPRLDPVGHVDQQSLVEIAARARVCLVTSRWESFHIGGHEALTMGATVVGTPITSVRAMTSGGDYGAVSRSHRTRHVLAALQDEIRAWDEGRRDQRAIAERWRGELSPRAVASRLELIAERA